MESLDAAHQRRLEEIDQEEAHAFEGPRRVIADALDSIMTSEASAKAIATKLAEEAGVAQVEEAKVISVAEHLTRQTNRDALRQLIRDNAEVVEGFARRRATARLDTIEELQRKLRTDLSDADAALLSGDKKAAGAAAKREAAQRQHAALQHEKSLARIVAKDALEHPKFNPHGRAIDWPTFRGWILDKPHEMIDELVPTVAGALVLHYQALRKAVGELLARETEESWRGKQEAYIQMWPDDDELYQRVRPQCQVMVMVEDCGRDIPVRSLSGYEAPPTRMLREMLIQAREDGGAFERLPDQEKRDAAWAEIRAREDRAQREGLARHSPQPPQPSDAISSV